MTEVQIRDSAREHDRGAETRTLVYDLPAPWLLHGLFRSAAYVSHSAGNATVTVALECGGAYATGMVVPTDGVEPGERSFDEWFSGTETPPQDKAAVTFRPDVHDVAGVVGAVDRAAERASEIRGTTDA